MPLPQFRDEAEFRRLWITPFLSKLGYIQVTHTHGTDEQGKDFIFADFDRFEHMRYCAVQAKLGKIGAADADLRALLGQVERAFTVTIKDRKNANGQRISAVYVMASGHISSQAREFITDHFRIKQYGENVYFLDGEQLETLERSAQQRADAEIRSKLTGLAAELRFNIRTCQDNKASFLADNFSTMRCRLAAMGALLSAPIPDRVLILQHVEDAWYSTTQSNEMCAVQNVTRLVRGDINRDDFISDGVRMFMQAEEVCSKLLTMAEAALLKIDEDIEVEVIDALPL